MKRRNKILSMVGAGLVVLAGALLYQSQSREDFVEVPINKVGYSSKDPLVSHDFANCSAIILDFGDDALMGHAFPIDDRKSESYTELFIENMIEEAHKRNLNFDGVEAIISFGRASPREKVLGSLLENGIKIREIDDSYRDSRESRSVLYYPRSDELYVADSDSPKMSRFRSKIDNTKGWAGF